VSAHKLHLVFAGTPQLAAKILGKLLIHPEYPVDLVLTRPDKPRGRGRKITPSPVKVMAQQHKIPVQHPRDPSEIDAVRWFEGIDTLIVVAYGMILPGDILQVPRFGCLNIHTSLLPRWRGAAPIQRAIQAGDSETGVTIMQMDAGLDTGPVLMQRKCNISTDETSDSLESKLVILGADCLIDTLDKLSGNNLTPVPQDKKLATYANKIRKQEAEIDWSLPAVDLERTIRAFNPSPVAHTELNGVKMRIWQATVLEGTSGRTPGEIIFCDKTSIDVATGDGILRLLRVQPAGKKQMTVAEFLNGRPDFLKPAVHQLD
jgi:methionyl-tRNA formyltransferase